MGIDAHMLQIMHQTLLSKQKFPLINLQITIENIAKQSLL